MMVKNGLVLVALAATLQPEESLSQQTWSVVHDLTIGSEHAGEGYALTSIGDLAVSPDGSMYTLHMRQEIAIRMFDNHGRFIRFIGREGDGPSEFRTPLHLGVVGDTLWIMDGSRRRAVMFDMNGLFRQAVSFPLLPITTPLLRARPMELFADGTALARTGGGSEYIVKTKVRRLPMLRVYQSGRVVDTLSFHDPTHAILYLENPRNSSAPRRTSSQPFNDSSLLEVAPNGRSVVVVNRQAATGPLGTFGLTWITLEGDTLLHRDYQYEGIRILQTQRDSVVDAIATRVHESGIYPSYGMTLEGVSSALYLPDYLPPVTRVVPGLDSTVWLRREDTSTDQVRWWVIDQTGTVIARVMVPEGLVVLAADSDHLWGTVRDQDDVVYLQRYRIRRTRD